MSTSGLTQRHGGCILNWTLEKCLMWGIQTYLRTEIGIMRVWDLRVVRWDLEQRTSSCSYQADISECEWAGCQVLSPASTRVLGMSLMLGLRVKYLRSSQIFYILHHVVMTPAKPVIRIYLLYPRIFSSLPLNVSYLNLMFLQYSTLNIAGYWPSYEWPGLCQGPSCQ